MDIKSQNNHKNNVHRVLAHSYTVYFVFLLIGATLDLIFKFKIFTNFIELPIGFLFLALGSTLIIWAQKTSRDLVKFEEIKKEHFSRGPYQYTRSPTNWGLLFLMLGFGIISNAFFVILTTLISFIVARYFFVDKQEKILEEKYGTHYKDYKKSVKF